MTMECRTYTGRVRVSIWKKLNPVWWFQNDFEQTLEEAPWYEPDRPQWLRECMWNFRNPLRNFFAVVIGVQDRNYTVCGKAPIDVIQRDDMSPPEIGLRDGWQYSFIYLYPWLVLPFISYSGRWVIWYAGWGQDGGFGLKWNLHLSEDGYSKRGG